LVNLKEFNLNIKSDKDKKKCYPPIKNYGG
jgi:hypothetical protein